MNAENENTINNSDVKFASASPSTQSEVSADGDNQSQCSTVDKTLTNSLVTTSVANIEPKAKKRRKQSNPIKCPNVSTSNLHLSLEDDTDLNELDSGLGDNHKRFKEDDQNLKVNNQINEKLNACNNKKIDVSALQNVNLSSLYNSKICEMDKLQRAPSKIKDSSLQSLTDLSSPESNDGLLTIADSKHSVSNTYPQMPPLVPLNPTEITGELSKTSTVFSPVTEVSLPVNLQPANINLTQSNRSFITSSGLRVFNPEAYCELCEKEFCNKYFLKTHKANKHGICSVEAVNSFTYRTPFKNMTVNSPITQSSINQINETSSIFGSADNYCSICQKSFCNKYFLKKHRQNIHGIIDGSVEPALSIANSIHVPVISSSVPFLRFQNLEMKSEENGILLSSSTDGNQNTVNSNMSSGLNGLGGIFALNASNAEFSFDKNKASMLSIQNTNEKYLCELCNIEFCDKNYLDTHKQNKHNNNLNLKTSSSSSEVSSNEDIEKAVVSKASEDEAGPLREAFKEQMCTPCMKAFTSAEAFQKHMLETHGALREDEDDPITNDVLINKKTDQNLTEKESKFSDNPVYNFLVSRKTPSANETDSSNGSNDSGVVTCNICFVKCRNKNSLSIHMEAEHGQKDKIFNHIGTLFNISDFSLSTPSTVRDSASSVDAGLELLQDKNQVKSHLSFMREVLDHSILTSGAELSDITENGLIKKQEGEISFLLNERQKALTGHNYCRICNKELCNKYFMKTHMWKMHGIDMDKFPTEKIASTTGGVFCDICQKVLCSKYFLKVHKQNVHGIVEDSPKQAISLSSLLSESYSREADDKPNDKCVLKSFGSSRISLASLSNHVDDSEDNDNSQKISEFLCEICGQEFSTKILLQFHLVNKHVNNSESKIANLEKILGSMTGSNSQNNNIFSSCNSDQLEKAQKEKLKCSCCTHVAKEAPNACGLEKRLCTNENEGIVLFCNLCNLSYQFNDYQLHHNGHLNSASKSDASKQHKLIPFIITGNDNASSPSFKDDSKMKPRKFKRFRCSKCDKKFPTRDKCLHHIQVTHKSKKGLADHNANNLQGNSPLLVENNDVSNCKINSVLGEKKFSTGGSQKQSSVVSGNINNEHSHQSKILNIKGIINSSVFHHSSSVPVPYIMPENSSSVIMQPFHLTDPKSDGVSKQNVFVPSLVYLPVHQEVSEPVTVAFTLTPA